MEPFNGFFEDVVRTGSGGVFFQTSITSFSQASISPECLGQSWPLHISQPFRMQLLKCFSMTVAFFSSVNCMIVETRSVLCRRLH